MLWRLTSGPQSPLRARPHGPLFPGWPQPVASPGASGSTLCSRGRPQPEACSPRPSPQLPRTQSIRPLLRHVSLNPRSGRLPGVAPVARYRSVLAPGSGERSLLPAEAISRGAQGLPVRGRSSGCCCKHSVVHVSSVQTEIQMRPGSLEQPQRGAAPAWSDGATGCSEQRPSGACTLLGGECVLAKGWPGLRRAWPGSGR